MGQKKNEIDISLIIPTYNSQKYILKTIASCQKFLANYRYELIIVDDGSKDNTINVIKNRFKNIKILKENHSGVSCARNLGIATAAGRYIMFCDSDDLLIGTLPDYDFKEDIISFSKNCSEKEYKTKEEKLALIAGLFGLNLKDRERISIDGGSYSKLFNRDLLIDNNIMFCEKLQNSEDVLFNTESIVHAKSVRTISQGIYLYVKRNTSVTHVIDMGLFKNHIIFLNKIFKTINLLSSTKNISVETELIEKIKSLYLYQLVFRYFVYCNPQKYRADYSTYKKIYQDNKNWSNDLNRKVEAITITIINKFGLKNAVYFSKLYLLSKKVLKRQEKSRIL